MPRIPKVKTVLAIFVEVATEPGESVKPKVKPPMKAVTFGRRNAVPVKSARNSLVASGNCKDRSVQRCSVHVYFTRSFSHHRDTGYCFV